jgi:hypothetical protein
VKKISLIAWFAVVGSLLVAPSGWAHHGDAGRYVQEFINLTGTVVNTQLVNPHAILVVDVTDAGKTVRWQAEMGGAAQLIKQGWAKDVTPGTKVTLYGRRLKSGAPYINLTDGGRVTLTDSGKVVMQSN